MKNNLLVMNHLKKHFVFSLSFLKHIELKKTKHIDNEVSISIK